MANTSLLYVFCSTVKKAMKNPMTKQQWKGLLSVGAIGVAEHLGLKADAVKSKGEEVAEVLEHKFSVESDKFHYVRRVYGKEKHHYKTFTDLKKEFYNEQIASSEARTNSPKKTNAEQEKEFQNALKKGQDKYSGAVKNKRQEKKLERQNRKNKPKSPATEEENIPVTEDKPPVLKEDEYDVTAEEDEGDATVEKMEEEDEDDATDEAAEEEDEDDAA